MAVDWIETTKCYNYTIDTIKKYCPCVIYCYKCQSRFHIKKYQKWKHFGDWQCSSCKIKDVWQTEEYRNNYNKTRLSNEFKQKQSNNSKFIWSDKSRIKNLSHVISNIKNTPEEIKNQSERSKKQWSNIEYQKKTLGKYYGRTIDEIKANRQNTIKRSIKFKSPKQYLSRLLYGLKRVRKDFVFDITVDDLLQLWHKQGGKCAITNIQMLSCPNNFNAVSIDRIDSNIGYIVQNVQLVCQFINFGKSTATHKDVYDIIRSNVNKCDVEQCLSTLKKRMSRVAKMSAKLPYTINFDYIKELWNKQDGKCALSGLYMTDHGLSAASIDRISSDKGHVEGNIQLVCRFFNLAKRHFDNELARSFIQKLKPVVLYDFNFSDIKLRSINVIDAKYLLEKFHYSHKLGRGGVYYGAFLNDELIAVCVFAPPLRKQSYTRLKCNKDELLELSRFVIDPSYQKKNFASWFISRCIKLVKTANPILKYLVSFADSTQGHDGIIYKASNWILDGTIQSDYHYVDNNRIIHKRTIWGKAKKLGKTELQLAEELNLQKVWGNEKYRYLWKY